MDFSFSGVRSFSQKFSDLDCNDWSRQQRKNNQDVSDL